MDMIWVNMITPFDAPKALISDGAVEDVPAHVWIY
jgi:hypothetical protein